MEELVGMKMHEIRQVTVKGNGPFLLYFIVRVPGGYLYRSQGSNGFFTETFVPKP